ncbi:copper homeostasis protein CutC [Salinibacterium sp. SYSU T00001]|uniref:copper homeostasis protein CutC n=1 Tax=Homoserinimonas sedimenticola TaxID=2986805 RepID=UPI002235AAA9|nr:copper homeostasis protein CutC [Salinibacterium sedimenticola]MCW4385254.1 copper homeostasis protein CutC [Salinibacterium sedimenticola]
MTILEVCLDDIDGAAAAERAGAERIELCAALDRGGITPSLGTVASVLVSVETLTVMVLVRQREGDFVYSEAEVDAMVTDVHAMRELPRPDGVRLGFVIGALTPEGVVDERATRRLLSACGDHSVTFHKAFDTTVDLSASLETLVRLGIPRVLTSGGAASVLEGSAALAGLVTQSAGRIAILAGGGVREHNARRILEETGVAELHFRAPQQVVSPGHQGAASVLYDSGTRTVTSPELVRSIRDAVTPQ